MRKDVVFIDEVVSSYLRGPCVLMLYVGVGIGGVIGVLFVLSRNDIVERCVIRDIRCLEDSFVFRSVTGRLRGMLEGLENNIEAKLYK